MSDFNKLGRPIKIVDNGNAVAVGTTILNTRGADGARFVLTASGGANLTVQIRGSADGVVWYPLGSAITFAADGNSSLWLAEPNTLVRADITARAAGQVDVDCQLYG